MRVQRINLNALAIAITMFTLMSCSKESLVDEISPVTYQDPYVYEAVASGPIHLSGLAASSINRLQVEDYKTDEGSLAGEDSNPVTPELFDVYDLHGFDTLEMDKVGSVQIEFYLKSNPYTRSSRGELVIQALADNRSSLRYEISGSDKIGESISTEGYQMQFDLISADGGFAKATGDGEGTLQLNNKFTDEPDAQNYVQVDFVLNKN